MTPNLLMTITIIVKQHLWMIKVVYLALFALFAQLMLTALSRRLMNKAVLHQNLWSKALLESIGKPLAALIWLMSFTYIITAANGWVNEKDLIAMIISIRHLGLLFIVTWFSTKFIKNVESNYLHSAEFINEKIDRTFVNTLSQLIKISVIMIAILIGMQILDFPMSGLLAFGGIGGAGIAFAAKDLFANFVGGLILFLDRPFKVGDWVRSPDKDIEGTVEHIGWRVTSIRTLDKRPLYVPNGVFLTISIENPSRMSNRRIKTVVGLRYDDANKIPQITQDIEAMLHKHPGIDNRQVITASLVEFESSSLNIMIYAFTKTTDWTKFHAIKQDILLKIYMIISQNGAQFAFPTQTLHLPATTASKEYPGITREHAEKMET